MDKQTNKLLFEIEGLKNHLEAVVKQLDEVAVQHIKDDIFRATTLSDWLKEHLERLAVKLANAEDAQAENN